MASKRKLMNLLVAIDYFPFVPRAYEVTTYEHLENRENGKYLSCSGLAGGSGESMQRKDGKLRL